MSENTTAVLVQEALIRALNPLLLDIEDEGYLHHGHAPSAHGLSYFRITLWSEQFVGHSKIEIHRMVYQALGTLMKTHIHALSIVVQKPR